MKRNLFDEMVEGFDALAQQRKGKVTLRTHPLDIKDEPVITGAELLALRKRLKCSRPVFAARLRVNRRTLENWEQGRSKPNAQAALLIRLAERYPDMLDRLAAV